jgi:hypothetical protein
MSEPRGRIGGNVFGQPRTDEADFWNLYDVFLNVHLLRNQMLRAPVEKDADPLGWFDTDRARLERLYAAFLFVMVEAWRAPATAPGVAFGRGLANDGAIQQALDRAEADGGLSALREVRDYMFHRDRREFWDRGREAVVFQMHTHQALYDAFSDFFLQAKRALRERRKGEGPGGKKSPPVA